MITGMVYPSKVGNHWLSRIDYDISGYVEISSFPTCVEATQNLAHRLESLATIRCLMLPRKHSPT